MDGDARRLGPGLPSVRGRHARAAPDAEQRPRGKRHRVRLRPADDDDANFAQARRQPLAVGIQRLAKRQFIAHGHNRGGLVWFYKDLWPATGWGILDNLGLPKAAYYYLRRSWQPQQITLTDEGLDGLHLHLVNETAQPLRATAELLLLKDGQTPIARKEAPCEIPPRSAIALRSEDVLGQFFDVNYAYRFGPPKHDVVIATLYDEARAVLSEAFYFPCPGTPTPTDAEVNIHVTETGDEQYQLVLSANRFLQSVNFDLSGFLPDDNYFHLAPHREKTIHFRRFKNQAKKFSGYIAALNLKEPIKFAWQSTHA